MNRRPNVNGKENDQVIASGSWEIHSSEARPLRRQTAKIVLNLKDNTDKIKQKTKPQGKQEVVPAQSKVLGTLALAYQAVTKEKPIIQTVQNEMASVFSQSNGKEQLLVLSLKINSLRGYTMASDFLVLEINGLHGIEKSSQVLNIQFFDQQEVRTNFKRFFYMNRQSLLESSKKLMVVKLIEKFSGDTTPRLVGYSKISLSNLQVLKDSKLLNEDVASPPIPIESGLYELNTIDNITKAFMDVEIVVGTLAWIDSFGTKPNPIASVVVQPTKNSILKVESKGPIINNGSELPGYTENIPIDQSNIDHILVGQIENEFSADRSNVMQHQTVNFYKRANAQSPKAQPSRKEPDIKYLTPNEYEYDRDKKSEKQFDNQQRLSVQSQKIKQPVDPKSEGYASKGKTAEAQNQVSQFLKKQDLEAIDNIFKGSINMKSDVDDSSYFDNEEVPQPRLRPDAPVPQPAQSEKLGHHSLPQPARINNETELKSPAEYVRSIQIPLNEAEYYSDAEVIERVFGSRTEQMVTKSNEQRHSTSRFNTIQASPANRDEINQGALSIRSEHLSDDQQQAQNQTDKVSRTIRSNDSEVTPKYSEQNPNIDSNRKSSAKSNFHFNNKAENLVTVPSQEFSNRIGFQTFNPNVGELPRPQLESNLKNTNSQESRAKSKPNSQLHSSVNRSANPLQSLIGLLDCLTECDLEQIQSYFVRRPYSSRDEFQGFINHFNVKLGSSQLKMLLELLDPGNTGSLPLADVIASHSRFIQLKIDLFNFHFSELAEFCEDKNYSELIEQLQDIYHSQSSHPYISIEQFHTVLFKTGAEMNMQMAKALEYLGFFILEDQVYLPNILCFLALATFDASAVKNHSVGLVKKIESLFPYHKLLEFDQSVFCEAESRHFMQEVCTQAILDQLGTLTNTSSQLNVVQFYLKLKEGILGQTDMKLIDYFLLFAKVQEFLGKENESIVRSSVSVQHLQEMIERQKTPENDALNDELEELNALFNSKGHLRTIESHAELKQLYIEETKPDPVKEEHKTVEPLPISSEPTTRSMRLEFRVSQLNFSSLPSYFANRLASLRFKLQRDDEPFESRSFGLSNDHQSIPLTFVTSFKFKSNANAEYPKQYFVDRKIEFIELGLFLKSPNRVIEQFATALISIEDIQDSTKNQRTVLITPLVSFFQRNGITFDGSFLGTLSYSFSVNPEGDFEQSIIDNSLIENPLHTRNEVVFDKELPAKGTLVFLIQRISFTSTLYFVLDSSPFKLANNRSVQSSKEYSFEFKLKLRPFFMNLKLDGKFPGFEHTLLELSYSTEEELHGIIASIQQKRLEKGLLKMDLAFTQEICEYFESSSLAISIDAILKDEVGQHLASVEIGKGLFELRDLIASPNNDGIEVFVDLNDVSCTRASAVLHINYTDDDLYTSSIINGDQEYGSKALYFFDVISITGFSHILGNRKLNFRIGQSDSIKSKEFVCQYDQAQFNQRITNWPITVKLFDPADFLALTDSEAQALHIELIGESSERDVEVIGKGSFREFLGSGFTLNSASSQLRHFNVELDKFGTIVHLRVFKSGLNKLNSTQLIKLSRSVSTILTSDELRVYSAFTSAYPFQINFKLSKQQVIVERANFITFLKRKFNAVKSEVDLLMRMISDNDQSLTVDLSKLFPTLNPFSPLGSNDKVASIQRRRDIADLIQDFLFYDEEFSGRIEEVLFDQISQSHEAIISSITGLKVFKEVAMREVRKGKTFVNYIASVGLLLNRSQILEPVIAGWTSHNEVKNDSIAFKKEPVGLAEPELSFQKTVENQTVNQAKSDLKNSINSIHKSDIEPINSRLINTSHLIKTFEIDMSSVTVTSMTDVSIDGKKPNSFVELHFENFKPASIKSSLSLREAEPKFSNIGKLTCGNVQLLIDTFENRENYIKICVREFSSDLNSSVQDICRVTVTFSFAEVISQDELIGFLDNNNSRQSTFVQFGITPKEFPNVRINLIATLRKQLSRVPRETARESMQGDLNDELQNTLMTLREIKGHQTNQDPWEQTPAFDQNLLEFITNNIQGGKEKQSTNNHTESQIHEFAHPKVANPEPDYEKLAALIGSIGNNQNIDMLKFESFAVFGPQFKPETLDQSPLKTEKIQEVSGNSLRESQTPKLDDDIYATIKSNPFDRCLGNNLNELAPLNDESQDLGPSYIKYDQPESSRIFQTDHSFGTQTRRDPENQNKANINIEAKDLQDSQQLKDTSKVEDDGANRSMQLINKIPKNLFSESEVNRISRLINSKRIDPDFFNFDSDDEPSKEKLS